MKTQQACLSTVSGEEIKLSRSWFSGKCVTVTVGGVMSAGCRMFCANASALVHTFPQSQWSQVTNETWRQVLGCHLWLADSEVTWVIFCRSSQSLENAKYRMRPKGGCRTCSATDDTRSSPQSIPCGPQTALWTHSLRGTLRKPM